MATVLAATAASYTRFSLTHASDSVPVDCTMSQIQQRPNIVPIQSLFPHRIQVLQPIHAIIQPEDGEYVATFFDANINASGESPLEAIESLKEVIATTFLFFLGNEQALGQEPKRQLSILRQFLLLTPEYGS